MFLKVTLNILLLVFFLIIQNSFLSFLPILSYLNLILIWLVFLRLTSRVNGSTFFGLAIFSGFLVDLLSPQFFSFYMIVLFSWALFFDWLTRRFTTLNLISVLFLAFLGFLSYEVIIWFFETGLHLINLTSLITIFQPLFFLRLFKVIALNTVLIIFILLRAITKEKIFSLK